MAKKATATLTQQAVKGTALHKSLGIMVGEGLPTDFFQRMIDDPYARGEFVRWVSTHKRRYDIIDPEDLPKVPKGYWVVRHTPMSRRFGFAPARCGSYSYYRENFSNEEEEDYDGDGHYEDTLIITLSETVQYLAGRGYGETLNACAFDFLVRYPKRYPKAWKPQFRHAFLVIFAGTVFQRERDGIEYCRRLSCDDEGVLYTSMVAMNDHLDEWNIVAKYRMDG